MSSDVDFADQIRGLSFRLAEINKKIFLLEHILEKDTTSLDEELKILPTLSALRETKGYIAEDILMALVMYSEQLLTTITDELGTQARTEADLSESLSAYGLYAAAEDLNVLALRLLDLILGEDEDDEHPEP